MELYREITPILEENPISPLLGMQDTQNLQEMSKTKLKLKVRKAQAFGLCQFLLIFIFPIGGWNHPPDGNRVKTIIKGNN